MFQHISGINYVEILYKRKVMIILIFLITVIVVFIGNNITRPTYVAMVKVLIEGPKGVEVPFAEELDVGVGRSNMIKTQTQIIKSNPIIEEVVRRLKLDERQIAPTLVELCIDSIKSFIKEIIMWPLKFLPKKESDEEEIISSHFRKVVEKVKGTIQIVPIKATDIIIVGVKDHNPYMAAKIANTIVQVYIDQSLDIKSSEARNAYYFITEQLKIMKAKLKKFEDALKNFKEKEGIISLPAEVESKVASLASFEAEYYTLQAQKKQLKTSCENLREEFKLQEEKIISSTTISENPIVKTLKANLTSLEVELPTLLKKYGKNHPKVMEVKSKINEVTSRLRSEVEKVISHEISTINPIHENIKQKLITLETDINALDAKEKALITTIDEYKSKLENLAEKELILARLTREVTSTEKMYNILLEKQQEAMISEAIKIGNIRVVEPALVPTKPISPNKSRNLLIGVLVSLMVGVTLAFILEYLDHSFKTPEEIEEYLKLPVLGLIPKKK
jgi:polysaccharide chain length determinant protein (PEP-CTERM system associated)